MCTSLVGSRKAPGQSSLTTGSVHLTWSRPTGGRTVSGVGVRGRSRRFRLPGMAAQFIFTMRGVSKFIQPDREVPRDITPAFYPERRSG